MNFEASRIFVHQLPSTSGLESALPNSVMWHPKTVWAAVVPAGRSTLTNAARRTLQDERFKLSSHGFWSLRGSNARPPIASMQRDGCNRSTHPRIHGAQRCRRSGVQPDSGRIHSRHRTAQERASVGNSARASVSRHDQRIRSRMQSENDASDVRHRWKLPWGRRATDSCKIKLRIQPSGFKSTCRIRPSDSPGHCGVRDNVIQHRGTALQSRARIAQRATDGSGLKRAR